MKALRARPGRHAVHRQRRPSKRSWRSSVYARRARPDGDGTRTAAPRSSTASRSASPTSCGAAPSASSAHPAPGTQEVTGRIHQLGAGVSQALGTGGPRPRARPSAASRCCTGWPRWPTDPATQVIVLVSKPPAPAVAPAHRRARRRPAGKPVVVIFLGADPPPSRARRVRRALSAQAADMAVALAGARRAAARRCRRRSRGEMRNVAARRRRRRRSATCAASSPAARSATRRSSRSSRRGPARATPTPRSTRRAAASTAAVDGHVIIDMGDDEFTQGRPHPMIDPSLRDARDPRAKSPTRRPRSCCSTSCSATARTPTRPPGCVGVTRDAQRAACADGRTVAFIGHVCGTDRDPQDRAAQVAAGCSPPGCWSPSATPRPRAAARPRSSPSDARS